MGPEYGHAYWPLLILSAAWMADLSQVPAMRVLTALAQHKRYAFYDAAVAASSLALAIILAPIFGIVGVAAGVAAPVAISALFLKPRFVARAIGLPTARYYGQIGKVMGGCLVLQVPVWLMLNHLPPLTLAELAFFGALTYRPVALFAGMVLLPAADQRYVLGLMPSRIARPVRRLVPYLRQPVATT
jgi:O-antigen/teichoic acid export membrane protein